MKKLLLIGVMVAFLSGCAVQQQKKESLSEKWAKQDELALKGEITDKTDKFTGERGKLLQQCKSEKQALERELLQIKQLDLFVNL